MGRSCFSLGHLNFLGLLPFCPSAWGGPQPVLPCGFRDWLCAWQVTARNGCPEGCGIGRCCYLGDWHLENSSPTPWPGGGGQLEQEWHQGFPGTARPWTLFPHLDSGAAGACPPCSPGSWRRRWRQHYWGFHPSHALSLGPCVLPFCLLAPMLAGRRGEVYYTSS